MGAAAGGAQISARDVYGTDNWGYVKKLRAPDQADDDWFGFSVSIAGNLAVVGSYKHDDKGAVYTFGRNKLGTDFWGYSESVTAVTPVFYERFGYSVAISNAYLVVGDTAHDNGTKIDAGEATMFFSPEFFGIPFFADGFESGDITAWEDASP